MRYKQKMIVVNSDVYNFVNSFFLLWSLLRDGVSAISTWYLVVVGAKYCECLHTGYFSHHLFTTHHHPTTQHQQKISPVMRTREMRTRVMRTRVMK